MVAIFRNGRQVVTSGLVLTGKAVNALIARIFYAAVEGTVFLLTPAGFRAVLLTEHVVLAATLGVALVSKNFIGCSIAWCVVRGAWVFVRAGHFKPEDRDLPSIWDWNPPGGDPIESGTWKVLRELASTMNKLEKEYPGLSEAINEHLPPEVFASRLYQLYTEPEKQHLPERERFEGVGIEPVEEETMEKIRYYRSFALLSYAATSDEHLADTLEEKGFKLVFAKVTASWSHHAPAYFLATSRERKQVVLTIRGTNSIEDAVTDLAAAGVPFDGGKYYAHSGMAQACLWLGEGMGDVLAALEKQGYTIVLVGHSLGAGVAALLSAYLKARDVHRVKCYAFATPCCADPKLAELCDDSVTSVLFRDDLVPRLSVEIFIGLVDTCVHMKQDGKQQDQGFVHELIKHMVALVTGKEQTQKGREMAGPSPPATETQHQPLLGSGSDTLEEQHAVQGADELNEPMPDENDGRYIPQQGDGRLVCDLEGCDFYDMKLSTHMLCVPGKIMYMYRKLDSSEEEYGRCYVLRMFRELRQLFVSPTMLEDHFIDTPAYEKALSA